MTWGTRVTNGPHVFLVIVANPVEEGGAGGKKLALYQLNVQGQAMIYFIPNTP
jgi:hypothetical protein